MPPSLPLYRIVFTNGYGATIESCLTDAPMPWREAVRRFHSANAADTRTSRERGVRSLNYRVVAA